MGKVSDLNIDEAVDYVDGLEDDELAAVREEEVAGRGRKTILERIDARLDDEDDGEGDDDPNAQDVDPTHGTGIDEGDVARHADGAMDTGADPKDVGDADEADLHGHVQPATDAEAAADNDDTVARTFSVTGVTPDDPSRYTDVLRTQAIQRGRRPKRGAEAELVDEKPGLHAGYLLRTYAIPVEAE